MACISEGVDLCVRHQLQQHLSADVGVLPRGGAGGGLKLLTINVLVKSVSPESGARMRQESDGLASTSSRPNTVVSRPDYPLIPEVLPSQKPKKR